MVDWINQRHVALTYATFAILFAFGLIDKAHNPAITLLVNVGIAVILLAILVAYLTDRAANDPNPTPKEAQRLSEAQERARLINDCDEQHNALLTGDERFGTYGRFPPPDLYAPDELKFVDFFAMDCVTNRYVQPVLDSMITGLMGTR